MFEAINIPFDPYIFGGTTTAFSWHGFLTFIAVGTAIWLAGRAAIRERLDQEQVYNTALWGVLGGIVGARIVHVLDNWAIYGDDPLSIFAVWNGGIGLWGGILGGWMAGSLYAYFAKAPVGRFMDIAAAPLLIAQTIGRVGDIINGEHWSRPLDLFWGWYFTDIDSPARSVIDRFPELFGTDVDRPVHPAVVYEMITNIIILGVIFMLRGRVRPAGSIFMIYLALYATARFGVQFVRLDDVKFWGLQEAHLIAILVWIITIPWIIWKVRLIGGDGGAPGRRVREVAEIDRVSAGRSRRERRRELAR